MTHVSDLFKLDGKIAVVTGGSRGLGFFAAEALAEAGATIAICGRDISGNLEDALEKLKKINPDCIALKCDISNEADVIEAAKKVKDRFGRCDILVNNAGIGGMVPSVQMTSEAFTTMMNTNLLGTFQCCREFGKIMIQQNSGCIINFSSENGQVGFAAGMTAYATSKIGVIGMSRSLAVEWGKHNIRVNAILPGNMAEGMMESLKDKEGMFYQFAGEAMLNMTPIRDFGSGDDIKGAVLYLSSPAARYVSGIKLVVDGGFTINSGL